MTMTTARALIPKEQTIPDHHESMFLYVRMESSGDCIPLCACVSMFPSGKLTLAPINERPNGTGTLLHHSHTTSLFGRELIFS